MAQIPDGAYQARTKRIADNLEKELRRLAAGTLWEQAERSVDLMGVAQTAYALDDAATGENKEAHALRAAAMRFERLLRRKRDKLVKENPFLPRDVRERLDAEIETVRRYTHPLNAEAQVALAVRDAFDRANSAFAGSEKIPTALTEDGPLLTLTRAALEYTPVRDRTPQALRKALEIWPVLRRQDAKT
jgi:hypothetical protein